MKKDLVFALMVACAANNVFGEEIVQPTNEQIDAAEQERKAKEPIVLDQGKGLDTEVEGGITLRDIAFNNKGTERQAKTVIVKYAKDGLWRIGYLKRLRNYPKAEEHIARGNATFFPGVIKEINGDGIEEALDVLMIKTQNVANGVLLPAWHEQFKKEQRTRESKYRRENQC